MKKKDIIHKKNSLFLNKIYSEIYQKKPTKIAVMINKIRDKIL